VLLESVDEFVVGRRLPVDVDGRTEVVEDPVERPEPGVVPPAVDVRRLDFEHLLAEPFGDELRDAGLARAAGTGDEGGVSGFAVRDRFEDAGEVVDFGVAMLDFSGDEAGTEHTSIANHLCLIHWFSVKSQNTVWAVSGKGPERRVETYDPLAVRRLVCGNEVFPETCMRCERRRVASTSNCCDETVSAIGYERWWLSSNPSSQGAEWG
jgi:hypothetical protein